MDHRDPAVLRRKSVCDLAGAVRGVVINDRDIELIFKRENGFYHFLNIIFLIISRNDDHGLHMNPPPWSSNSAKITQQLSANPPSFQSPPHSQLLAQTGGLPLLS